MMKSMDDIQTFKVKGVSFDMVYVEGGTFWMGAQKTDPDGRNYDPHAEFKESPVHQVTLSDYYIGMFPVTQGLWKAVMGDNPSEYQNGDDYPVEYVGWDDCQEFIRKLNRMTGRTFALPTEAQWEFAARGGNKGEGYKYSGGTDVDEVAWYASNIPSHKPENPGCGPQPVGAKASNELGLYDMSGNVWEWCADWYAKDYHQDPPSKNPPRPWSSCVLRGGSWYRGARHCRVSSRHLTDPDSRSTGFGLRLALLP